MAENKKEFSYSVCGRKFDSKETHGQYMKGGHPVKGGERGDHVGRMVLIAAWALIIVWVVLVVYLNPMPAIIVERAQHTRGDEGAPVTMIEFGDFECSFSRDAEPTLAQILQNYTEKVRLVYRHFPIHSNSMKAAEASECAGEQGKFWEYHDMLFRNQADLALGYLKDYAAELGLNATSFDSCLDSGTMARRVQADFNEGEAKGVTGTPTFFINGSKIVGAQPISVFRATIDRALAGG